MRNTHIPKVITDAVLAYTSLDNSGVLAVDELLTNMLDRYKDEMKDQGHSKDFMDARNFSVQMTQLFCDEITKEELDMIVELHSDGDLKNAYQALKVTNHKQANKSLSPHSPIPKVKKPYWIKLVSSVDYTHTNAFGLKGKFLSLGDLRRDRPDMVVVCTKDKGTSIYSILKRNNKNRSMVHFPNNAHTALSIDGYGIRLSTDDYHELTDELMMRNVHATVIS